MTKGPWMTHGQWVITGNDAGPIDALNVEDARLIAAAPDMHEALKMARGLIEVARTYFPKSIQNNDRFKLENTCAAIGKAIAKAKGE